jgi:hypothetical protein
MNASKMPDHAFNKGIAMILVMTYSKDYTFDPAKEAVIRNLYRQAFANVSEAHWLAVIQWWIQHENHFPLIPELRTHLARMFPPTKHEPLSWRSMLEAPKRADCAPWQPVCGEYARWKGAESIFEVAVPILREYVRKHPEDRLERDRLASWEERVGRDRKPVGVGTEGMEGSRR